MRYLEINLLFLLLQLGGRWTREAEEMYQRLLIWHRLGFSHPAVEALVRWQCDRREAWVMRRLAKRWKQ